MNAKDAFGLPVQVDDTVVYVDSGRSANFLRAKVTKIHPGGGINVKVIKTDDSFGRERVNVARFIKYQEPA